MTTKYNFTKLSLAEFGNWLSAQRVGRTILKIQQHHTYIPSYQHFNGSNHFEMQRSMRNTHMNINRWSEIAQHFTIFPDGTILTGRSLEDTPAGIVGQNTHAICLEHIGFFDRNKDEMTPEQRESIVKVTALLCQKFNLPVNTNSIIYHHWFSSKSCPGTNFFGGNKRVDCETHFLPLVKQALNQPSTPIVNTDGGIQKYALVTANSLNVRTGPGATHPVSSERGALLNQAIIRVYEVQNGWYKISRSANHWVSGKFTIDVQRYIVVPKTLNVRSGPGTTFFVVDKIHQDENVFITEISGSWARIGLEDRWVSKSFLQQF
jgi:hypothetical protein